MKAVTETLRGGENEEREKGDDGREERRRRGNLSSNVLLECSQELGFLL